MKHVRKLNQTMLLLLKMLWQMPYASAGELELWPMAPAGRVYPNLRSLVERGFIGYETLGWMRDAQRRFFLWKMGVHTVMQHIGWPMHWAVTASAWATIRSYGPMLECLYDAAPRFWRPDWVSELERINRYEYGGWWGIPDSFSPDDVREIESHDLEIGADYPEIESRVRPEPSPDSFTWLRKGPLAALIGMRQGPNGHRFWVPLVWYGTHPPRNSLPGHYTQLFAHLQTENDPVWQLPCFPPGAVVVATDFLAAARAAREIPRTLPRMMIVYESQAGEKRRFGVARVESLETEYPHGLGRVVPANRSIALR